MSPRTARRARRYVVQAVGARHHRCEGVDDPHRRGGRVVEPTRGGTVEDGRPEQVQRPIPGVEGLAVVDRADPLEWELHFESEALDQEEVADQRGVRAAVESVEQPAGVVTVVVRQEDPTDVFGLDDREDLLEPELSMYRCTGVDDDRLGATDDHRIDRDVHAGSARGEVRDDERLGGDLEWFGRWDGSVHDGFLSVVGCDVASHDPLPVARVPSLVLGVLLRRSPLCRGVPLRRREAYRLAS